MRHETTHSDDCAPKADVLAIHVVAALSRAQRRGRTMTLESLARALGARKTEVRGVVTRLDREGYVDATRMRLTLLGFALGASVANTRLCELRPAPQEARRPLRVAA
jgi:DNA-binding IclR family transcriptional regulator